MELFAKIVKKQKLFTISPKISIVDVSQGSGYAFELASKVNDISFEYQK